MFSGLSQTQFDDVADWVVENELWPKRRQQVVDQLAEYKAQRHRVLLVSGMVEPMLARIAAKIGVEAIGTPLIFKNGAFTGEVISPFITGENKVLQIKHIVPVDPLLAAFGDTAADIPMLSLAERPVAVSPDRRLKRWAVSNRCQIIVQTK